MGGIFHLELVRTTLHAFSGWARRQGCRVLGGSPGAGRLYTEVEVTGPLVVMLGEERRGLSEEELAACTDMARIPILGRADSLNVGVAAGVLLYEVVRRRGWRMRGPPGRYRRTPCTMVEVDPGVSGRGGTS